MLEPVRWIRGGFRWKVILVSVLYIYNKCAFSRGPITVWLTPYFEWMLDLVARSSWTVWWIQVEVFWVVTSCSVVVEYQSLRGPCRSLLPPTSLHSEDGGSMDLWNFGILPQHYTTSQLRRLRLETSPLWKPQNSHRFENCWLHYKVCLEIFPHVHPNSP
jgi:hypothetical protein